VVLAIAVFSYDDFLQTSSTFQLFKENQTTRAGQEVSYSQSKSTTKISNESQGSSNRILLNVEIEQRIPEYQSCR
jgi:hypothetical protein